MEQTYNNKKHIAIILSLALLLTGCESQEESVVVDMEAMKYHAEILTQQLMLTAFDENEIKEGRFSAPDEREQSNFVIASVLYRDREGYLYSDNYPIDEDGYYHFPKEDVQEQLEDVFALENWSGEISDSYSNKDQEWTLLSGFGIGNHAECSNIASEIKDDQILVSCDVGSSSQYPNAESWGSYEITFELHEDALRFVKAENIKTYN